MSNYYGSTSAEVTSLELENREVARRAARESFVLLKNEGALPLKNKKIALYGTGGRRTVAGGIGSGAVQYRHAVSIEEGLENAGYEITTKTYLDDYDAEYNATYKVWHDEVEEKIAGIENPMQALMAAMDEVYRYPSGRLITDEDIVGSSTDTALYVLMRQAGEGNDRKWEPGDFQITEVERRNLEKVATSYDHVILVINVGGLVDLSFLDEIPGINGLVFFVQGGIEGGNALADVLSGKENFSGRLADTWPERYEDIPAGEHFSYLDGNLEHERYTEGIYVGYRYYDTFGKIPRYPFGYGLSYTQFEIKPMETVVSGTFVSTRVFVKNTGDFAGKQVVQLYLSFPDGRMQREKKGLVAFGKTENLEPSKGQEISLTFDMADFAAYDSTDSVWLLEAGDYLLCAGESSQVVIPVVRLVLDCEVVTERCRPCCIPESFIDEIMPNSFIPKAGGEVPEIRIDSAAFHTVTHDYAQPDVEETAECRRVLDTLTVEEMAELVRGGDLQGTKEEIFNILGASGHSCQTLWKKGIPNVIFADGPAGINVVEHVRFQENGVQKSADIPKKYNWGKAAVMMRQVKVAEAGIDVYRYATSWPVEELLAQSWNSELLEEVGRGIAREMEAFGVALWLAPGMNIHRNPLCGRTFEYFSEDPYLTGKLAAAVTRGVQSIPGCGSTIKHFCCNNQEDNRNGVSSDVNERALREIYLKGFRIAVRESAPWAVMSSYNKLNGIYTANRHDLCTDILRCEWDFHGVVMTDWNSCGNTGNGRPEECVPAGNDLVMPGSDYDRECILKALNEGKISFEALRRSAARVLMLVLKSNTAKGSAQGR